MSSDTISSIVRSSVERAASSPDLAMTSADVPAVTETILTSLAPTLDHLANREAWYMSRVTWGAIISSCAPVLAVLGVRVDWLEPDLTAQMLAALGAAVGAALTLHGRWKAKTPLGR